MMCSKCSAEFEEHYKLDSFNDIYCCPKDGILIWVFSFLKTRKETWVRSEVNG
jgi:hypothetical protein